MYQNNRKWLFLGVYKPPNQNDIEFLNRIGANLHYYFQKNDNVTIIGDFNITNENTHLQSMMQAYNLNNLIKEPTYFQSNNPSQIILYSQIKKVCINFQILLKVVYLTIINSYQLFQNQVASKKHPE